MSDLGAEKGLLQGNELGDVWLTLKTPEFPDGLGEEVL